MKGSGPESDGSEGHRELRPLHAPVPAAVRVDEEGRPVGVRSGGRMREVVQIREVWRIDDEWWREPVSRLYFEVILGNGSRILLYRDLAKGGWYEQEG